MNNYYGFTVKYSDGTKKDYCILGYIEASKEQLKFVKLAKKDKNIIEVTGLIKTE